MGRGRLKGSKNLNRNPNQVTHNSDGTSVLQLTRKDGTILGCVIDTVDYDKVVNYHWLATKVAKKGNHSTFYAKAHIPANTECGFTSLKMHRLLMPLGDGRTPDHIDRNGLNNRQGNLRPATPSQQSANRKTEVGVSGHRGIAWDSRASKWRVRLEVNRKKQHFGLFVDLADAVAAADAARQQVFGKFAGE